MQLGPNLLYNSILSLSTVFFLKNTIDTIFLTRHKNLNNLIIMFVFLNLLQISLNIFQKLDLDNLIIKKPVLVKKKIYQRRKKLLN